MRKYYDFREDLYIKGRWFIDGPIDDNERDERDFRHGHRVELRGPLTAPIHTAGIPLDFTLTLGHIPILSKRLADAVHPLVANHAQLFPVQIEGYSGFEVLNPTMLIHCVDEASSEIIRFTEDDGRPDKIGQYLMIRDLKLDANRIPDDLHVFRIMGWELPLIVSQAFVDAIQRLNPIGPKLELVT